jgi:Fungal protein kinase
LNEFHQLASGSSNQKRKLGPISESSNKKQKSTDLSTTPSTTPHQIPAVQSGLYAAERLSHAHWIRHAINLVVIGQFFFFVLNDAIYLYCLRIDDIAYLWWCDREGAIQSYGINFIQDLPHFLVLLLCFQRFNADNWGVISAIKGPGTTAKQHSISITLPPSVDVTFDPDSKLRGHYGIVGRGTRAFLAKSKSTDPRKKKNDKETLDGVDLVLKTYWPETSRTREDEIIGMAKKLGKGDVRVEGHLPDLICSYDFIKHSTGTIREQLGIPTKVNRVFRVMLSRRLYPITELTDEQFWKAFWECFRCKCRSHCYYLFLNFCLY